MEKKIFLKWLVPLALTASLLFGCGGHGKDLRRIEGDPELLYKNALARFNEKNYHDALKKFEELKSSFPDSPPYTVWAELRVGDCHFLKKEYVEAIAAYEEFKKTHPGHEETPYVQFQIGMSYFSQMRTLDRDQTNTKKALSSFEYLIANYPPSLFTDKAREKARICTKQLADHEFYVGDFYYRRGKFQSAALRFERLLEQFPKDPDQDKTLYFLGKCYLELGLWERAESAFKKIVAEHANSPYQKEAQFILTKGMTEMEISFRKTKASNVQDEGGPIEPDKIALIKFEEEGKQPVSQKEEKRVALRGEEERSTTLAVPGESAPMPSEGKDRKPDSTLPIEPAREDRTDAVSPSGEAKKAEAALPVEPMSEDQSSAVLPPPSTSIASSLEVNPEGEKQVAAIPSAPAPAKKEKGNKEDVDGKTAPKKGETKVAESVDRSQPIDVTSDKVEARWKENLVIFRGNVIARQKDMVIYSDSLEVMTNEDGKGIERAVAGGNVKIQQGSRVANCEKAVFYNPDQKLVLTGDPKVSEGDNVILGDEITFLIDKNRVEVKGGPSGRGKAKIHPGEVETLK